MLHSIIVGRDNDTLDIARHFPNVVEPIYIPINNGFPHSPTLDIIRFNDFANKMVVKLYLTIQYHTIYYTTVLILSP